MWHLYISETQSAESSEHAKCISAEAQDYPHLNKCHTYCTKLSLHCNYSHVNSDPVW